MHVSRDYYSAACLLPSLSADARLLLIHTVYIINFKLFLLLSLHIAIEHTLHFWSTYSDGIVGETRPGTSGSRAGLRGFAAKRTRGNAGASRATGQDHGKRFDSTSYGR